MQFLSLGNYRKNNLCDHRGLVRTNIFSYSTNQSLFTNSKLYGPVHKCRKKRTFEARKMKLKMYGKVCVCTKNVWPINYPINNLTKLTEKFVEIFNILVETSTLLRLLHFPVFLKNSIFPSFFSTFSSIKIWIGKIRIEKFGEILELTVER